MRKTIIVILLITINSVFGQDLQEYKKIYKAADSITTSGKIGVLDNNIFSVANSLDLKHPMEYFKSSGEYLKDHKYNEASFLFYLGYLRYKYYNSSNPDYQAGNDGALLGSFSMVMGEPINMYLRSNIDNFISILESTIKYNQTNDYKFYSKEKDVEKYNIQVRKSTEMLEDMKFNKKKYSKDWKKERKQMEKIIDDAIKENKEAEKN
jgi:hypothetical protein